MRSRSRSRSPSRKASKSSRRSRSNSRSRSKRSKKSKTSRYHSPERKSSKYRNRSSSDSLSPNRHRSSKQKSRRHRRSSSSSGSSNSRSSNSNSKSSSSSNRRDSRKPSSSYIDKIRSMRTPTPPKITFSSNLEFLDNRVLSDALDEINADKFVPKAFNSAANANSNKKDEKIVEVKREAAVNMEDDPLFHKNLFADDDERMERWVKKVYSYRQKLLTTNE